jgi:hypothetical protein
MILAEEDTLEFAGILCEVKNCEGVTQIDFSTFHPTSLYLKLYKNFNYLY